MTNSQAQPDGSGAADNSQARHQAMDYPFEWARRFELWLDSGHRRAFFYGGLFGAFVTAVVTAALIFVLIEY